MYCLRFGKYGQLKKASFLLITLILMNLESPRAQASDDKSKKSTPTPRERMASCTVKTKFSICYSETPKGYYSTIGCTQKQATEDFGALFSTADNQATPEKCMEYTQKPGVTYKCSVDHPKGTFEASKVGMADALLDVCSQINEKMKLSPKDNKDQGCFWVISDGQCLEVTGEAGSKTGLEPQQEGLQ